MKLFFSLSMLMVSLNAADNTGVPCWKDLFPGVGHGTSPHVTRKSSPILVPTRSSQGSVHQGSPLAQSLPEAPCHQRSRSDETGIAELASANSGAQDTRGITLEQLVVLAGKLKVSQQ